MSEKIIYDGADLTIAMGQKINELETALNDLLSGGIALATAERDYKEALTKQALSMKTNGYSATMIDKIIYGTKSVAEARYTRDVAEAVYEARRERVNSTKLEIRVLENQIAREYGKYGAL